MVIKQYIPKALIALAISVLTSCASTSYFTIDVMQPAHLIFPESIVNIAIADNAGAKLDSISIQKEKNDLLVVTSRSKDVFMESLAQFLKEENYFNAVTLYPHAARVDTEYGTEKPLGSTTIREIAALSDADAVISINKLEMNISKIAVNFSGFYFNAPQMSMGIHFQIYNSNGIAISPIMAAQDSVTWLDDGAKYNAEANQQLALQMSEGMVRQLVPHWEQQERCYYSDGTKLMKEAKQFATNKNWAEALNKWQAAFENPKDNKQKARIASNIALAYENMDDINSAITWIRTARELINEYPSSADYQEIAWYQVILLKRRDSLSVVRKQMGVSEIEE